MFEADHPDRLGNAFIPHAFLTVGLHIQSRVLEPDDRSYNFEVWRRADQESWLKTDLSVDPAQLACPSPVVVSFDCAQGLSS